MFKAEVGVRGELGEAGLLEGGVVIIVEIINPDDFMVSVEQLLGDVEADESGCAGDEEFHYLRFMN